MDKIFIQTSIEAGEEKNIDFDLTIEFLQNLWDKQQGACALTGIVFQDSIEDKHKRRPYIPSIDRMQSEIGYLKNNVRFVCVAVNMALFTWGEKIFDTIVMARIEKCSPIVDKVQIIKQKEPKDTLLWKSPKKTEWIRCV